MTDVLVQYANSTDRTEAVQIKNKIEELSQLSVSTKQTTSPEWSNYYGVIVVGGENANPVYAEIRASKNWKVPADVGFGGYNQVVTEIDRYNNTVVQGVAGYFAEDTVNAVDAYTGADSISNKDIIIGSSIDEFVQQVQTKTPQSDSGKVQDPALPGSSEPVADPDAKPSPPTERNYENKAKISPTTTSFLNPGTVTIEVTQNMKFEAQNKAVYGKKKASVDLAFNEALIIHFNGKISNLEYSENLYVRVNGNRFVYSSEKDKITEGPMKATDNFVKGIILPSYNLSEKAKGRNQIKDSQQTKESQKTEKKQQKQKNQSGLQDILQAITNPTSSIDNATTTAMLILVLFVILRASGVAESLSGGG